MRRGFFGVTAIVLGVAIIATGKTFVLYAYGGFFLLGGLDQLFSQGVPTRRRLRIEGIAALSMALLVVVAAASTAEASSNASYRLGSVVGLISAVAMYGGFGIHKLRQAQRAAR